MFLTKTLEKVLYSFGSSCANIYSPQFEFIRKKIPPCFKNREILDIGCGDGKVTQKLAGMFEAKKIKGIDYIPALVKSASKNGIEANVLNIEKEKVSGEMAVMWGVLHHLKAKDKVLEKLAKNFKYVFIREHFRGFRIFEIGHPIKKENLTKMYKLYFGEKNIQIIEGRGATFLFYKNPK